MAVKAETKELKREILEALSGAILILNNGRFSFANKAFFTLFGFDPENVPQSQILKRILTPASYKQFLKISREHLEGQVVILSQGVLVDGTTIDMELSFSILFENDAPVQILMFKDVTSQNNLIASLKHYQAITENSTDAIAIINKGKFSYCNRSLLDIFGFQDLSVLIGQDIETLVDPDNQKSLKDILKKISLRKLSKAELKFKIIKPDGAICSIEAHFTLMGADYNEILVIFRDITEIIHEREEIRDRIQFFSRIDGFVSELSNVFDLKKFVRLCSERVSQLLGMNVSAFFLLDESGKSLKLDYHKNIPEKVLEKMDGMTMEEGIGAFVSKTLEPHAFTIQKYPSYLPFRSVLKDAGMKAVVFVPLAYDGKFLGLLFLANKSASDESIPSSQTLIQITQHLGESLSRTLQMEQAKKTVEEYRLLVETSPDISYRLGKGGNFLFLSGAIETLTGYTRREFYRTPTLWLSLIHPDDKKLLLERQTTLDQITEPTTIEYRLRPKGKAAYRYLRDTLVPFKEKDESDELFPGTIRDLTEFTDLEENTPLSVEEPQEQVREINESEELLLSVIDTMGDVLVVSDLEGNVKHVNNTFSLLLGYTEEEAKRSGFPYPWLLKEHTGRFVIWMTDLKNSDALHDFDMVWQAKDGRQIDMSVSTTLVRDSHGEATAILTIARDISERRRLNDELAQRSEHLELMNRMLMAAEQTMDFNEIFQRMASELKKIISFDDVYIGLIADPGNMMEIFASYGISQKSIGLRLPIDQSISKFTVRGKEPVILSNMGEDDEYSLFWSYKLGIRSQISFPIISKGRILGTLNFGSKDLDCYQNNQTKLLQLVAQQIGVVLDRVLLFRKVSEDAAYIHNLLDSIEHVVYTVGLDHKILEVNRAWNDFILTSGGVIKQDYLGAFLFEVLPGGPLKALLSEVLDSVLSGSIRYLLQELRFDTTTGEKVYQVSLNPMVIEHRIVGVVISHIDISELKKFHDRLIALNNLSSLIKTSHNGKQILDMAVPLLQRTVEAEAVLVYLENAATDSLILTSHTLKDDSLVKFVENIPYRGSAAGNVLRTKEPLYIDEAIYDNEKIYPEFRPMLKERGAEALGIVPMVSHDKAYGVIYVIYKHREPFGEQRKEILSLFGSQLGAALENTHLYSELHQQLEQLKVLYDISRDLTSTLEIDKVFELVCEHMLRVIHYEQMTISLYDEKKKEITTRFTVEQQDGKLQIFSRESEKKTGGLEDGERQVVFSKRPVKNIPQGTISIPMLSKEHSIGIMSIKSGLLLETREHQMKLVQSIANLAAIAFEKSKLYHETVEKTEEIERRNRELDDFTYVVSHDLKEPLISIQGFSKIIEFDYGSSLENEGKENLNAILAATTRMKSLIDDLLKLSRISRPSETFQQVSIQEIISEIQADYAYIISKRNAAFVLDDNLPVVFGNRAHMKILFQNLISNAIKFNEQPQPLIEIGFQNAQNNSYLFFVKDNGIGIEKDFFDKIFVIFQRLNSREAYEGTGAGLAIVKKIIEMHHGSIWVESTSGKGSTFYFTLPKTA